jgi:hypothetical protein
MSTTQNQVDKGVSVNVALCGSIPRAHLTKGLHRHKSDNNTLAPSLDKRTDYSRCGSENITLLTARPSLQIFTKNTNNENTRPVTMGERQPLAHVFEAPSWAVPASGETRLEVRDRKANPGKKGGHQVSFAHILLLSLFLCSRCVNPTDAITRLI